MNCYSFVPSIIASRVTHTEMLKFAARDGTAPVVEEFRMDEAGFAEALDKLKNGKIRYRAVLAVDGALGGS